MAISRRSMILGSAASGTAALTLAACGGDSGSGSGAGGDGAAPENPVLANGSEPQNPLIPTHTNETGGGRIVTLLFSGLVSYDAEGKTQNEVAKSIDTEDSQTYTITLNEGWTFSDDTPVTAQNFVDAWNYGANVNNAQNAAYFFESIEGYDEVTAEGAAADATMSGLTVDSETQFTVKLRQPESDFPLRLGYTAFSPLPESFFEDPDAFGEKPVGNGPYVLSSWEHNVQAELAPNEKYEGPRKAKNGGVRFTFYQDQETAYNDLLSGGLDVLDAVPDSAFGAFETDLGERAVNQPAAIFQSFTIHMEDPNFTGEAGTLRRQALSYAIDRAQVCKQIFQDTRTPAKDFSSPVVNGYAEDVEGNEVLAFDAAKAKELWAKAEEMQPFTGPFTLAYNADGGHQNWVDAVCNQLRNNLGIEATGNSYPDFKSLRDDVAGRTITGAYRTGWQADYPSLFNFLGPLYTTAAADGNGSNDGDYKNEEFDAKLQEGLAAKTEEEGIAKAQEAETILFRDLPAIPLWYSNVTGGSAETVSDVQFGWDSAPVYYAITKQ